MYRIIVLLAFSIFALSLRTYGLEIQSMKSTNLLGHYTDELPKASEVGRFTQPLAGNPKIALEYRIESKQEYVMLLESQEDGRWKIVDSLLIPKHASEESVSFACSNAGGSPPGPGAGSLGIVKQVKNPQAVTASHGWRVNLETKKLERVGDKKTICDLRGVD